jgi:Zn-dependent peptidase ImmA (M78 family)
LRSNERRKLINQSAFTALQLRIKLGKTLLTPLSIYDFTEELGIEVRFVDVSSMEGMYIKKPRLNILISSLRPTGRQRFTCAHELGHHIFSHGMKIDEIVSNADSFYDKDEFVADCFAGFLLMPKLAIQNTFKLRGWNVSNPTFKQIYAISCYFGVGYTTLLTHMCKSIKLINTYTFNKLKIIKPKNIKRDLIGFNTDSNVIIVDNNWQGRAIDVQVGDIILTSHHCDVEGTKLDVKIQKKDSKNFVALGPGIIRIFNNKTGWSSFVRISRTNYIGLNKYRHLEE